MLSSCLQVHLPKGLLVPLVAPKNGLPKSPCHSFSNHFQDNHRDGEATLRANSATLFWKNSHRQHIIKWNRLVVERCNCCLTAAFIFVDPRSIESRLQVQKARLRNGRHGIAKCALHVAYTLTLHQVNTLSQKTSSYSHDQGDEMLTVCCRLFSRSSPLLPRLAVSLTIYILLPNNAQGRILHFVKVDMPHTQNAEEPRVSGPFHLNTHTYFLLRPF